MQRTIAPGDRVVTWVVVGLTAAWAVLYATLGPALLRPVSACSGGEVQCSALVDAGVGAASWGPLVVVAATLLVIRWRRSRGLPLAIAAAAGVVGVFVVQVVGQALIPFGITAA